MARHLRPFVSDAPRDHAATSLAAVCRLGQKAEVENMQHATEKGLNATEVLQE